MNLDNTRRWVKGTHNGSIWCICFKTTTIQCNQLVNSSYLLGRFRWNLIFDWFYHLILVLFGRLYGYWLWFLISLQNIDWLLLLFYLNICVALYAILCTHHLLCDILCSIHLLHLLLFYLINFKHSFRWLRPLVFLMLSVSSLHLQVLLVHQRLIQLRWRRTFHHLFHLFLWTFMRSLGFMSRPLWCTWWNRRDLFCLVFNVNCLLSS